MSNKTAYICELKHLDFSFGIVDPATGVVASAEDAMCSAKISDPDLKINIMDSGVLVSVYFYNAVGGLIGGVVAPGKTFFVGQHVPAGCVRIAIQVQLKPEAKITTLENALANVKVFAPFSHEAAVAEIAQQAADLVDTALMPVIGSGVIE